MALFKCKACGGDIIPNEDKYTGKCEYCNTIQTLPKDKDERTSQILNRANEFRLSCDFDRAIFEYEKVLEFDETEPEAHWGLFLSKYGVEYVKDTMTLVYKPTLHRISSMSVYDDVDYQATLKYASFIAAEQYKADAGNIEQVMKELLLLSANQEPYDIFLSYKELDDITRQRTDDSYLAHDLYNELTAQGYKVFFAPKSLGVGLYEPKIYSAIISAKVMIVLGTKPQYLEGVWVKNEWSRFAELIEKGEDKVLIPVFKNMEAGQLPNRIAKYQAYDMASMTFLPMLFDVVSKSVKKESKIEFDKNTSAEAAFIERGFIALEDREFSKADFFFENALNLNPHSSQAYFGKLMVEMGVSKKEQILTSSQPLNMYKNFEKAVRFADQQQKTVLLQYEEKVQYTLDEQNYNKANALINKENPTESDCSQAAEIFKSITNFKNAKEKEAFCYEKVIEFKKNEIWLEGLSVENRKTGDEKENYREAIEIYKKIPGWKDADERVENCEKKIKDIELAETRAEKRELRKKYFGVFVVALVICGIIVGISAIPKRTFDNENKILVMSDGTVFGTGKYGLGGECDVTNWTDITAVSAGNGHVVGLKSDGTVVAIGANDEGQCDIENWTDIVSISAGGRHTVGLKSDGTVVAVGTNDNRCDVSEWTNIVAISAGRWHTLGLKSDGTVVEKGDSDYLRDLSSWSDIVDVSVGANHTVGLKSDGTVLSVSTSYNLDCNISYLTDIVDVFASENCTVALKSNGTISVVDNYMGEIDTYDWNDIVAVSANEEYIVGLKSDGTIIYEGDNLYYECVDYKDKGVVSILITD